VSVVAGDRVRVPIDLVGGTSAEIAAMDFELTFDPSHLSLPAGADDVDAGASTLAAGAELSADTPVPPGGLVQVLITPAAEPAPVVIPDGTVAELDFLAADVTGEIDVCFLPDSVTLATADGTRSCVGELTCGTVTVMAAGCEQGDCNGDGDVDPGDLVCMVNRFFGVIEQISPCEDCNRDGTLDSVDSVCIVLCAFDSCPAPVGTAQ
jgi:hypothetical protein